MRHFAIALSLALFPSGALAENPDWVRENTQLVRVMPCTDNESGERGTCFLSVDPPVTYMTFVQDGQPVFIRRVVPGQPYQTIWRAPVGEPL